MGGRSIHSNDRVTLLCILLVSLLIVPDVAARRSGSSRRSGSRSTVRTGSGSTVGSTQAMIIAFSVIGGVGGLTIIILLCCYCSRKKRAKIERQEMQATTRTYDGSHHDASSPVYYTPGLAVTPDPQPSWDPPPPYDDIHAGPTHMEHAQPSAPQAGWPTPYRRTSAEPATDI